MTFAEVIKSFKMRWDPSKIINSLEKTASFCDESENYLEDNNSGEDFKNNNPYSNLVSSQVISSGVCRRVLPALGRMPDQTFQCLENLSDGRG